MKNLKALLFVVATTGILHAQDTIYTKNGKTINAKVYEVTQNEVRYQNSSNLEGPMYTIDKSQVSAIEYKNGTKDSFTEENSTANQTQPALAQQQPNQQNNQGANADDVYNQGDPQQQAPAVVNNNYYTQGYPSNYSYYNPGVCLNFMFGMPSLFWGVPYYAGPWGGWPYYRSYYRPYWAYNYYRPWGWNGYAWGGYGGWGWRGYHGSGYYNGGYHGGGYHGGGYYGGHNGWHNGGYYGGIRGGSYYGSRGHKSVGGNTGTFNHGGYYNSGTHSFHNSGGSFGGGHGFGGGGYHGGGGGGYHGGGGGHGFGGGHHR